MMPPLSLAVAPSPPNTCPSAKEQSATASVISVPRTNSSPQPVSPQASRSSMAAMVPAGVVTLTSLI